VGIRCKSACNHSCELAASTHRAVDHQPRRPKRVLEDHARRKPQQLINLNIAL
jgi:hypothetical protein